MSLALASGCATGGSGPCVSNCAAITVAATGAGEPTSSAGLNLPLSITATISHAAQSAVTWSITGTSCTGSGSSNPCGYFTATGGTTATYMGPAAVPTDPSVNIVATSQADSGLSGTLVLTVVPDTTYVAPNNLVTNSLYVGLGLTQQFASTVTPDWSPQTQTWTCLAAGAPCASFTPAPGQAGPGVATYTPVLSEECGNGCVQISSVGTIDTGGCGAGQGSATCTAASVTVVNSRVNGTYAFQFSGFDNSSKPVSVAGTFTASANPDGTATVTGGVEDVLTASGPNTGVTITGGQFTPSSTDPNNSNNAGTLTLTNGAGVYPVQYQIVLDGPGDIQMIESDSPYAGKGQGIAEATSTKKFNQANATYAFGFTGVDSSGNRIGYAGLLPMVPGTNGGTITGGLIDVNDNGHSSNAICTSAPCNVAGSYAADGSISGLWHLTLTSPHAMAFDFFVANGNATSNNPLNLYAISTDSNPAVLGTLTLQDAKTTYNNAGLSGTSVSVLAGANDNVALVLGSPDGTSSGSGVAGACPGSGTGGVTGQFDQNNAGAITAVGIFPSSAQSPTPYTYVATNNNTGRYIFCMLGNPSATPSPILPIPFVVYASGANRGYVLDQSSASVMTGAMYAQNSPKLTEGDFTNTTTIGTFAVATNSNSVASVAPVTMNLLLTAPGNSKFNVNGTQNPGGHAVTGAYTAQSQGYGTITLTAPAAAPYVIYGLTETQFFMIEEKSGAASPVFYLAQ